MRASWITLISRTTRFPYRMFLSTSLPLAIDCRREAHKAAIGARAASGSKVRIADIGPMKMLRSIANVRFGEAATQRPTNSRMAAMGRE